MENPHLLTTHVDAVPLRISRLDPFFLLLFNYFSTHKNLMCRLQSEILELCSLQYGKDLAQALSLRQETRRKNSLWLQILQSPSALQTCNRYFTAHFSRLLCYSHIHTVVNKPN